MRLTLPVFKVVDRWAFRQLWLRKGYLRATPSPVPKFLEGVQIVDPNDVGQTEPKWHPPYVDDPRFQPQNLRENHPDYHQEPVYEYHLQTRLLEGLRQACRLTKTQTFEGLPKQVEDLIGVVEIPNQDELVQRYIMQANVWDPTKDKLPRRLNRQLPGWKFKAEYGIPEKRRHAILMRNLVRLCQTLHGRYPDLLRDRRLAEDAYVSARYVFQGDKPILVRGLYSWQMSSSRPLPALASRPLVEASVDHTLPEFYPVSPTIDLTLQHVYREENITGWRDGFTHAFPHTMFLVTSDRNKAEDKITRGFMMAFAQCLAHARRTYGDDATSLPKPVVTQCVVMDSTRVQIVCFQLNTLDFSSETGVKNFAWVDTENQLYDRILPKRAMLRNTRYEDYDPEVFKKFLALYIHGANLDSQ